MSAPKGASRGGQFAPISWVAETAQSVGGMRCHVRLQSAAQGGSPLRDEGATDASARLFFFFECLRRPVVRLPNIRLSRPHLRRALQALQRVRDAVVYSPGQAIQQSAPPPGREREVSAIAEHATARVDRRTRDPVVADQPERHGGVESDRVPHRVHFQNLAVDAQPPTQ